MRDASVDRAVDALRRGEVVEARRLCRDILKTREDDPLPWRVLGAIDAAAGDLGAARTALETSLRLDPSHAESLLELARIDLAQGRRDAAVVRLEEAARASPGPILLTRIGEILGNLGMVDDAEVCFRRAMQSDPASVAARFNLALARMAAGSTGEACQLLEQVVSARPGLAAAWLYLGGALNALGKYAEAIRALRRHLELKPESPEGHTWLGASLQFLGDFEGAEERYREAVTIDPGCADAHANLGKLLLAQEDPCQAEFHFRCALDARPDHVQALSGLAAWLDDQGCYQDALDLVEDHAHEAPGVLGPIHARILRHLHRPDQAIRVLDRAEAEPGLPLDARVQLAFSRAAAADESGDYAAAWEAAETANRLRREVMPAGMADSDIGAMEQAVADLRLAFSKEEMSGLARSRCPSERPVFIVGMPRSGKSLAEQILCSHASVSGAGELRALGEVSSDLAKSLGGWPGSAARATTDLLGAQAGRYLAVLEEAVGTDAARVTDTMPFNFVHLGLIEMLFPGARVVHCVRHPLDLVLRCYFKNFAGRSLSFAFSLDHIARYYLSYRSLMLHWEAVSGLPVYLLRYESLVTDPEQETAGVLKFLGLPWDPACLRFYETGVATSAGPTPIRRPLDQREVGAWTHYAAGLSDVSGRLPVAEYEHGGF